MCWNQFFPTMELKYPPFFEGIPATLPNPKAVKDGDSWIATTIACM
jgi:hypothetical protein